MTSAERLEESKNFWHGSAEYQKDQFRLSIAIGSSGLVLAGVGIGLALSGHPAEGALAIGGGGGLACLGAKEAIDDFHDLQEINNKIGSREGMAKGMSMASSREC